MASISTRESAGIISIRVSLVSPKIGRFLNGQPTLRNRNPFQDRNSLFHDGVVLHIRHGEHAVDLLDAEPVEDVRHEGLEAHL